jgi:hypothetical protein
MPLHLIDFYNFKPPAELVVHRDESQAIRVNAAKTCLVGGGSVVGLGGCQARTCRIGLRVTSASGQWPGTQAPASQPARQPYVQQPWLSANSCSGALLGLHSSTQFVAQHARTAAGGDTWWRAC